MKRFLKFFVCLGILAATSFVCNAQKDPDVVFKPIAKYISQGDYEALGAWFDDNLEVLVNSTGGLSSRAQAKQIMKAFFKENPPESFTVSHTAGNSSMKYILADLRAGGELFHVSLFLCSSSGSFRIQQLKISRML